LLFERDRLLPFVEGTCEEHLTATVIPGEFGQHVGVFNDGFVICFHIELSKLGGGYPELLMKLMVLFKLPFFWKELLEAGLPM
jgi:hypothetical protein